MYSTGWRTYEWQVDEVEPWSWKIDVVELSWKNDELINSLAGALGPDDEMLLDDQTRLKPTEEELEREKEQRKYDAELKKLQEEEEYRRK